jgi:hypothetical protein
MPATWPTGLYSMAGGGRMIVANATSEEDLRAMLQVAPDAPREWTFTGLFDGIEVIQQYLESTRSSIGTT